MALQVRFGPEEKYDDDKMTVGEWAVSTDTRYVRMCFAPGIVYRMATYESFEEDMIQIQQILATCEDIQTAVEAFEALAQQHANDAAASATASTNSATESANSAALSEYWAGVAQDVADVQIMTPTTNGIGKPDDVTIGVTGGTFSTKFKNYTSLADIGLTAPVTCLEIATAMDNNSRIELSNNNYNFVSDSPPGLGTVVIERLNSTRSQAFWYSTGVSGVINVRARMIRVQELWVSGWSIILTNSNLVSDLLATTAGNALDATMGKALDDKITTLKTNTEYSGDVVMSFGTLSTGHVKQVTKNSLGLVTVNLTILGLASVDSVILTLPTAVRPSAYVIPVVTDNFGVLIVSNINTSGQLSMSNQTTAESRQIYVRASYYVSN